MLHTGVGCMIVTTFPKWHTSSAYRHNECTFHVRIFCVRIFVRILGTDECTFLYAHFLYTLSEVTNTHATHACMCTCRMHLWLRYLFLFVMSLLVFCNYDTFFVLHVVVVLECKIHTRMQHTHACVHAGCICGCDIYSCLCCHCLFFAIMIFVCFTCFWC